MTVAARGGYGAIAVPEVTVVPDPSLVPDAATMRGWIQDVFDQGIRRPGTSVDRWAQEYVRRRFEALGLERVRLEPVDTPYWAPRAAELVVGAGDAAESIHCFATPFSEPGEVRGDLVRVGAPGGAAKGRVALVDLPFVSLPAPFPLMVRRSERIDAGVAAPVQDAGWCHDPDAALESLTHIPPFSVALMQTMEPAVEAGAIGFVGVLRDYPGGGCEYYVPYDGTFRPIPGVYVCESDGDRLDALIVGATGSRAAAGDARVVPVRLRVDAERGSVTTHNVVGELAGADDEWVVVGSHHDGPWASAVEDAAGIALLLAQAEYWSRVAVADRPHRLVFTADAAHMSGGRGADAFCARHESDLGRIVLEVHLEHPARECVERDGNLEVLDTPVPRWWFTSENPELERAVWDALVAEGLDRSLIMTPTALGERPTTDGGRFHLCGVPIVNYLTAPWYLFDPADTLEKVHDASLEPLTRAAVRLIEWTAGRTAAGVRAGIRSSEREVAPFGEAVRSLLLGEGPPS